MASDQDFVKYVCEQLGGLHQIAYRKMFGEYAIYYDEKVVALVCDNQLFVKPTAAGRAIIGQVVEAPPYPSAKPYFLIDQQLDDRDWLANLIQQTASELPKPKPKKSKSPNV